MSPPERGRIGVVEDDPVLGGTLVQRLKLEGYAPAWWQTGHEALKSICAARPDLVVCDIRLPDMDGWRILDLLKRDPDLRQPEHRALAQRVRNFWRAEGDLS